MRADRKGRGDAEIGVRLHDFRGKAKGSRTVIT